MDPIIEQLTTNFSTWFDAYQKDMAVVKAGIANAVTKLEFTTLTKDVKEIKEKLNELLKK